MLIRFCLYGFLKNQRYFEPFLVLAFLAKGLSFLQIGVLLAVEGVTLVALEIPSGAIADLFGRRRSLLLSFGAYLASFLVLAAADSYWALCGAMVLYGVGESFRSGSHKALIFTWLKQQGRADQKTRIYGLTRSWSKYGSALSALIAAALVYATASYTAVFYWSMVPCVLSIVNLLGYPAAIDPPVERRADAGSIYHHLVASAREVLARSRLRRLIGESMAFHGLFRASKDYLQPALVTAAVVWFGASADELENVSRSALLVGPVYFLLFVAAALASRHAHRVSGWAGGDAPAARALWGVLLLVFVVLALASAAVANSAVIVGFVVLFVTQNAWRPIMTARIYDTIDEQRGATVLSIESQGHRLATAVLAPLFGFLFDQAGSFWPIAAVAALVAVAFLLVGRRPAPPPG